MPNRKDKQKNNEVIDENKFAHLVEEVMLNENTNLVRVKDVNKDKGYVKGKQKKLMGQQKS